MGFPSTISSSLAFGVPGEILLDGPLRAQPGVLKGTAANIVVGRAFTIDTSDGQFSPGGTGIFGGILANPKEYVSFGAAAGATAPTMTLAVGTVGDFVTSTPGICLALTTACTIGQGVYFINADGTLGAGTAGAGQTQIAGAQIVRYSNAAAGLAMVSLTGV